MSIKYHTIDSAEKEEQMNLEFKKLQVELLKLEVQKKKIEIENLLHKM